MWASRNCGWLSPSSSSTTYEVMSERASLFDGSNGWLPHLLSDVLVLAHHSLRCCSTLSCCCWLIVVCSCQFGRADSIHTMSAFPFHGGVRCSLIHHSWRFIRVSTYHHYHVCVHSSSGRLRWSLHRVSCTWRNRPMPIKAHWAIARAVLDHWFCATAITILVLMLLLHAAQDVLVVDPANWANLVHFLPCRSIAWSWHISWGFLCRAAADTSCMWLEGWVYWLDIEVDIVLKDVRPDVVLGLLLQCLVSWILNAWALRRRRGILSPHQGAACVLHEVVKNTQGLWIRRNKSSLPIWLQILRAIHLGYMLFFRLRCISSG